MKPDPANLPPQATLDEIGSMATVVTQLPQKPVGSLPAANTEMIETSPDMPTIAVANPSRQLPAATMHSASSMASMGGKKGALGAAGGEDGWISDRYRLLDKLGEGGFGIVYRAEQVKPIQRLVAIKLLKAGLDSAIIFGRFAAERQTLALMEHPNIARVLDAGETESGMPYFVMELVKGRSITTYCNQNELDVRQRLELFVPVCQAVHHAHQKGIIHRDLKPSNVMVCDEAGKITPKVIDFGIAKVLEGRDISQAEFTGVDQLVGTPGYISPEQIEHGSSHVDTRSDVYALGSILFELMGGKALITPADIASKPIHILLRDLAERDAPKPSTHTPDLPADVDWIVLKALERDPARRYSSADDLADDITRYLTFQPISARPPSRTYLMSRFVRRHRVGVSAAASIALAVVAGGITSTALYFESEKNRALAEQAGDDLRRSYSRSDEQMARQFTERGQFAPSAAYLARALRTDPRNSLASTNLITLLEHVHLMRPVTHPLTLPEGAQEAHLVTLSRQAGKVLAVSRVMSGKLAAPMPDIRLERHEVLSIWDMKRGAASREDHPLSEELHVTCLRVTPDGKNAVITKTDGSVELWSLEADGKRRVLQPKLPSIVLSVALSADGRVLIAGSETATEQEGKGTCHVWDLTKPEAPARAFTHPKAVMMLDVDAQGEVAVAGSVEGIAQVWDLKELKPIGEAIEIGEEDKGMSCLSLHREKKLVAAGTNSGTVYVGNYESNQLAIAPLTHPGAVLNVRLSADGATLHAGDSAGYMHAWGLSDAQPLHPPHPLDGEITTARVADDSGLVASISKHGEVNVWNSLTGQRLSQRLQYAVASAGLTDDCTMLALAPRLQGFVQVWNVYESLSTRRFVNSSDAALIVRPPPPEKAPDFVRRSEAASWNRALTHVIAADNEGYVQVFEGKECRPVGQRIRHAPAVGATALTNDGKVAITSGRDQFVRVWDVQTGKPIASMPHDSFVEVLALAPDDETLVTFTEEGHMRLWRIRTGECLTPAIQHGAPAVQGRVADDGKTVLFRLKNAGWFSMPMPAQDATLPEWFLQFSEALAGNQIGAQGRLDALDLAAFERAAAAVPAKPAAGEEQAHRIASWLLSDPAKRTLTPEMDETRPDYLQYLRSRKGEEARAELKRFGLEPK